MLKLNNKNLTGAVLAGVVLLASSLVAAADKPNILVVWGDDVGQSNISTYTHGLVGYHTPNIDRIANEGLKLDPRNETIC